jgi:Peptidase family S41
MEPGAIWPVAALFIANIISAVGDASMYERVTFSGVNKMEQLSQSPNRHEQKREDERSWIWLQEIPEQMLAHVEREEWHDVTTILGPYLEQHADNGDYWGYYGLALEKLGQDEEAVAAYHKAIEYGNNFVSETAYQLGRTLARLGKGDEALHWLDVSLRHSLRKLKDMETESAWDGLRDDPRFQRQLPPLLSGDIGRVTGWQQDLNHLAMRMEQAHYDLFGPLNRFALTKARWREAIEQLRQRIPTLADHEIVTELMKIIVLVGDGHSRMWPFDVTEGYLAQHETLSLHVPVMFYAFKDGLFVRAAAPHYQGTVGARVLAFGETPVEQALERVNQIVPRDNVMNVIAERMWVLMRPSILCALGIAARADQLTVQLVHEGGEPFLATLQAERGEVQWKRWGGVEPDAWVSMRHPDQAVPLWLKDPENFYWFEYLPEQKLVYCQYNQIGNKQDEPLDQFCERLFAFIDTHEVEALILDLRLNGGGNLTTHRPLLHSLIGSKKMNLRGHLFAIIGRRTFSAAQNFCGQLELHTAVTFVGEPTGSCPNVVGEDNAFWLPFSGMKVNASNLYWQAGYAFDHRQWTPPHLHIEMTSSDYKSSRDPVLEALLEHFTDDFAE